MQMQGPLRGLFSEKTRPALVFQTWTSSSSQLAGNRSRCPKIPFLDNAYIYVQM